MDNVSEVNGESKMFKPRSGLAKSVAVILLAAICYAAGYQTGHKGFVYVPKEFKVVNQKDQPGLVDYNLLWDAIKTVNDNYIEKPIDQQKILYGAVKGAIDAIGDPYTTYFPPQELDNFQTGLRGSFGGIGAEIGKKDGNLVIVAPLDDTPAKRAGLLPNDIIYQVNGTSTQDWSVDEAVSNIRGPKGTSVTLSIVRAGKDKPFDVTLVRDIIKVKSVKWTYKQTTNGNGKQENLAVITLSQFGDDTKMLFDQAVGDILNHHVDGIILDLRNNPGGYLNTAVDVASYWVKPGDVVVSEAHSDGTTQKYNAEGNNKLSGIKTVVLINGGSASAAEILSGALHDHGFAQLVGEKSFGKGSVQQLINLTEGGAVKVTIAKWITPGGVNLNHNGLNPDVSVKLTEDDVSKGQDPQMDAAVQQITK